MLRHLAHACSCLLAHACSCFALLMLMSAIMWQFKSCKKNRKSSSLLKVFKVNFFLKKYLFTLIDPKERQDSTAPGVQKDQQSYLLLRWGLERVAFNRGVDGPEFDSRWRKIFFVKINETEIYLSKPNKFEVLIFNVSKKRKMKTKTWVDISSSVMRW